MRPKILIKFLVDMNRNLKLDEFENINIEDLKK